MPKILIIHPYDKTTLFLKGIYAPLAKEVSEIAVFNIDTNYASHTLALDEISNPNFETIVFMGHGRNYTLFGATGDDYDEKLDISEAIMNENPNLFSEQKFIYRHNIQRFSKKKIFCLSCRSVDNIGKWSIEEGGAKVFIGFGDIPTDSIDYQEDEHINIDAMTQFRQSLNQVVKLSLLKAIKENMTFEQLALLIKINVHKEVERLIKLNSKTDDTTYKVIWNLLLFKSKMKLFGNKDCRLIE